MTLIEKTLKENIDKLLTKIASDYTNYNIGVASIFERLEKELPVLLTQALQEQERDLTEKVRMDRLVLDELIAHYKEQDRESRRDIFNKVEQLEYTLDTPQIDFKLKVLNILKQDETKGSFAVWTPEIKEHAKQVKEIIENRERHEN